MNKKILGLILARGGSKRVPGKNIKDFLGKPLLSWTIQIGKESKIFDRFLLSTDDEQIAAVGRGEGVEVPFLRPAELATDVSPSLDAVVHAVKFLQEKEKYTSDWIILLEPSSPGRQKFHLQEVAKIIEEQNDIDSIASISEVPPPCRPEKAIKKDENNLVTRISGKLLKDSVMRNQEVPVTYYNNSTFYAFKTANLFAPTPSLWGEKTFGYVMDEKYACDIDTPIDWILAEAKMKHILENTL